MPLKKKGQSIPVTDENKMEYLSLLTEYRMVTSVKDEVAAFLEGQPALCSTLYMLKSIYASLGLNELIPEDLLTMFDEQELEVSIRMYLSR